MKKTHSLDHEHILSGILRMSVMWKRYVWEREPKEKRKTEPYIKIISIMPVNIVVW